MNKYVSIFPVLVISALGIIVYSHSFYVPFQFDDQTSIVTNDAIRNIHHIQDIWNFLPRRFILYLSIALNYHFNGLHVLGYHVFNLAVHLISSILVWWLMLLTFSCPLMENEKISRHSQLLSLFAGLVFVAHPVQTEAVTYIVQRAASMQAMFYLASVSFYVKSRLLQDKKPSSAAWKGYYIASLTAAIMAMFTKETAITLPLIILLYEYCFLKTKKNFHWPSFIPFLLTIIIIPVTMLFTETGETRLQQLRSEPGISSLHYLLTQFRVIITYVRLVFMPVHQNLDYDYPVFKGLFEIPVFISFLSLMAILLMAQKLFLRFRLVSFSIFWFFLTLLPESSFLPIKDVIFEHRLYLPLVGYSMFIVSGCYYIFKNRDPRVMVIALSIIVGAYSVLAYQRNEIWKSEFTLWNDCVQKSPHKARPYNNRGRGYAKEEKYAQAITDYNQAIEIDPKQQEVYCNRGFSYGKLGHIHQAISDYNKCIELDPNAAENHNNRGIFCFYQGNDPQALSDFDQAIRLDPNYDKAYYNRGLIYAKRRNYGLAIEDFNKAIEINPSYEEAYYHRGLAYASEGNLLKAIDDFTSSIGINPNDARAFYNRGLSYTQDGNFPKAISDYNKAIEISPKMAEAYNNRGVFWAHQGELKKAILDYDTAIEINPNYVEAYYNRGNSYYNQGDYLDALKDYDKVIEVHPRMTQALTNRAVVYFDLNQFDQAARDVRQAEELGANVDPGLIDALKKTGASN